MRRSSKETVAILVMYLPISQHHLFNDGRVISSIMQGGSLQIMSQVFLS